MIKMIRIHRDDHGHQNDEHNHYDHDHHLQHEMPAADEGDWTKMISDDYDSSYSEPNNWIESVENNQGDPADTQDQDHKKEEEHLDDLDNQDLNEDQQSAKRD